MPFQFAPPIVHWQPILPMIIVALTGIVALILEFTRPRQSNEIILISSLIGLAMAGTVVLTSLRLGDLTAFDGRIVFDSIGKLGTLLVLISSGLTLLFSESYLRRVRIPFGEFYPLALWSTLGAMILCVSRDLLMIFLGIEVLSLALYVMAGMRRGEEKSEEAALKYFLLGAFATGFFLFGAVMIYGATGVLDFSRIGVVWAADQSGDRLLLGAGFALVFVGLGFKSSFVPFHQWTPDVYQGAPTNVTAFMGTAAKIGPFIAVWRLMEGVEALRSIALPAVAVVAALTMTFGNLMAVGQKDLKRLLGYSSVANAGYVLAAIVGHFARPTASDFSTLITFLLGYVATTIGVFAIATLAARDGEEPGTLSALHGLNRRSPFAFIALVVFVLSQIGIPFTAGFLGKVLIIAATLQGGYAWLGVFVALNSIISIVYYFAIVQAAYATDESEPIRPITLTRPVAVTSAICLVSVVGIFLFYGPLAGALGLGR